MADTRLIAELDAAFSGETLTLLLFDPDGGAAVNGAGDDLAEPDAEANPGHFETLVAEALTGVHFARILRSGVEVAAGYTEALADDDGPYWIGRDDRSGGAAALVHVPLGLQTDPPPTGNVIRFREGSFGYVKALPVVDAAGDPVDLSGRTLKLVFETHRGVDVAVIAPDVSEAETNVLLFTVPSELTEHVRTLVATLWDQTDGINHDLWTGEAHIDAVANED